MEKYTISGLLTEAAKKLRSDFEYIRSSNPNPSDKGEEAEEILRQFLNHHLPQRFRAAEGIIIDNANQISKQTDVIVYDALASPIYRYSEKTLILPVDTVAAVIEVKSRLNKSDLEDAYKKVMSCKSLKKRPISEADQPATGSGLRAAGTFGVIFGLDSDISLATLASHTEELDKQYDSRLRPDMILVLDKGVISYMIQFPGENLGGNLMPTDSEDFLIPPVYIYKVLREDGIFSLNRFFTNLLSHLTFYPRRLGTPPFEVILEGTAKAAVTLQAFQYNLSRQLLPVEIAEKELKLPSAIRIDDTNGKQLGYMQFYPWADGGVVKYRGDIPFEALLVLAEGMKATHVFNYGGFQFSGVLPITETDFRNWPTQMNPKMDGMRASLVQWKVVEVADEGTSSPFIARLLPGMMEIRDKTLNSEEIRRKFDVAFEPVMGSLLAARQLLKGFGGPVEPDQLKQLALDCLSHLKVMLSAVLQVSGALGISIEFLAIGDAEFERDLKSMRSVHPLLANYIETCREKWLRQFLTVTANAEKGGQIITSQGPHEEFFIEGVPALRFLETAFDRVCSLIESTCIYAFGCQLPKSLVIREIPIAERQAGYPRRFEAALYAGDVRAWELHYSDERFSDQ